MPSNLVILVYEILFKKIIQYIKYDKLGIYSKDALKIITMIKKTKIRKVLIFGLDLIKLST